MVVGCASFPPPLTTLAPRVPVLSQAYTEGVQPFNWKEFIAGYVRQPWFYTDRDANGMEKAVGWAFLAEDDAPDEEEEDEESSEYEESDESEEEEVCPLCEVYFRPRAPVTLLCGLVLTPV